MSASNGPTPGDLVVAATGDGYLVLRAGATKGLIVEERHPWTREEAMAWALERAEQLGVRLWVDGPGGDDDARPRDGGK